MVTYEMEKVRYYRFKPDHITWLAESENVDYLIALAKEVKLRHGKTFEEKVRVMEIDDHGDIINYPYIRYFNDKVI